MDRIPRIIRATGVVLVLAASLALLPYVGLPYQPLEATALRLTTLLYDDGCYDFDSDGEVDPDDIGQVALHWNSVSGGPNYVLRFDVTKDGRIDMEDIITVTDDFGEDCD